MSAMQQFTLWFLNQLPAFLLAEPVSYFVGLIILGFIVKVILTICGLSERRLK